VRRAIHPVRVTSAALLALCGSAASSCRKAKPPRGAKEPIVICTLEARPGVAIDIRDSISQRPLRNATLRILSNGRVVESARTVAQPYQPPDGRTILAGVYEKPGVYDAMVSSPGYATWRRDDVHVVRGPCHVESQRMVANMRAER